MATVDEAIAWALRGFRVFPLEVGKKTPALKNFPTIATKDANVIRGWWKPDGLHDLDYNIGVLTTDMIVVDIDTKQGKQGLRSWTEFGSPFDTLIVRTPSGGFHCYFDGPDSIGRIGFRDGLDLRSHNNYVVAPGSFVVEEEKGVAGFYEIHREGTPARVPPSLAGELHAPGTRVAKDDLAEWDAPTAIANASAWLLTAPIATEYSGGDDTTYRVACRLTRDYALTIETAYHLMWTQWNERCLPPWDGPTLWKKIENADQYASGSTGAARPEMTFGTEVDIPSPSAPPAAAGTLAWGNALDGIDIPLRPWLVKELLMYQYITVLIGGGGMGKSTFTLVLAAHMAVGQSFMGYPATAPTRSIVYNAEDDLTEQSRKLLAICLLYRLDYYAVRKNILLISSEDWPITFAYKSNNQVMINEPHIKALIDMARDTDIGMVGLDPAVELHNLDENNPTDMKSFMSVLRRIAREANVAVVLGHHTSKGVAADTGNAEKSRGSTAITNAARIVAMLSPPTKEDMDALRLFTMQGSSYVRLDVGKMQFGERSNKPRWLMWRGQKTPKGDDIGVLLPADQVMRQDGEKERTTLAEILRMAMLEENKASISLNGAVELVMKHEGYSHVPHSTMRAHLQKALSQTITMGNDVLMLRRELHGVTDRLTIVLTSLNQQLADPTPAATTEQQHE